jgi:hypothetical protein
MGWRVCKNAKRASPSAMPDGMLAEIEVAFAA